MGITKRLILVLLLVLFTLTGCENLQNKVKEISYKDVIEKLNVAKIDTTVQKVWSII